MNPLDLNQVLPSFVRIKKQGDGFVVQYRHASRQIKIFSLTLTLDFAWQTVGHVDHSIPGFLVLVIHQLHFSECAAIRKAIQYASFEHPENTLLSHTIVLLEPRH
jgi:hypothetical protein